METIRSALRWASASTLLALLGGCATSIGTYEQRAITEDEVVVLVGIDSSIPLSEARHCAGICTAWYQLGGRKEVMAFPARVGSTFQLTQVNTMDRRAARLDGGELRLERRGIYYYGTIHSTYSRVGLRSEPDDRLLHAARLKYGQRFDKLDAVNFRWPSPLPDGALQLGYESSPAVQAALRAMAGRRLHLARVSAPAQFDPRCRGGGSISLPDFLPYEEYIRHAFNRELRAAGLHDDGPGALQLAGALTELTFSTTGGGQWTMGLQVGTPQGPGASTRVTVPFDAPWAAAQACPRAEDAVPDAVRKLIEAMVTSPDFRALTGAGAPQASK
jgi:hypothetical protein